jgi:hypothetical protein
MGKKFKFTEKFRGGSISFDVDKVLYNQKSRFQNIFIGQSHRLCISSIEYTKNCGFPISPNHTKTNKYSNFL